MPTSASRLPSTQTLNRWWQIRMYLGDIMGISNNMCFELSAYVKGDRAAQSLRITIVRYLNLAHGLLYHQARGTSNYDNLIESGIMTEDERLLIASSPIVAKYNLPYAWITNLLVLGAEGGRLAYLGVRGGGSPAFV